MSATETTEPRVDLATAVNSVFQAANNVFALAEQLVYTADGIEDQKRKTQILKVATDLAKEAKNVIRGQQRVVDAVVRTKSW